jgi:hypothetical protein
MGSKRMSLKRVRVVLGAYSTGNSGVVSGAVVDVDEAFMNRVKKLSRACKDAGLVRVVAYGGPEAWLPNGVELEARFTNPEMDVSSDGVLYRDHPKHSDESVESRWVSIEQLDGLREKYAGQTVQLEGAEIKVLWSGTVSLDDIGDAINAGNGDDGENAESASPTSDAAVEAAGAAE